MALKLKTAPASTPITLTEAKDHCRVDDDASDTYITGLIAAATAYLDGASGCLGKAIITQTWEQYLDAFTPSIEIEMGAVASITSIKYYDTDNVLQTVDSASYALDNVSLRPWVVLRSGYSWPTVADGINNVIIEFVAGAATADEDIKHLVKLLVGQWYENREASGTTEKEMPFAVESLINKNKAWVL